MAELDLDLVRHALGLARKNGFAEVELAIDGETFTASLLPGAPAPAPSVAAPAAEASTEPKLQPLKATLVGYYREAKKPLQAGDSVKKGEVVAVIAALGIANDVESNVTGEVVEVLVANDQPVEYGQPLALVRPT